MSQYFWSILPFFKSSLQITLHIMYLIFTIPKLIPNQFSDSYILLPSFYNIREPFLLSITNSPSDNVFLQKSIRLPVYVSHHLFNLLLCMMLFPHEFLKIGNFTLSFPVFGASRTTVVLIIKKLSTIMRPFPLIKYLSQPLIANLSKQRLQLIASLLSGPSLVFELLEAILKLLEIRLSDHAHDIECSHFFIVTVHIFAGVCECSDGMVGIKQYLCSHKLLKSAHAFCQVTYISELVAQSPNYCSFPLFFQFINQYFFSSSLIFSSLYSLFPYN